MTLRDYQEGAVEFLVPRKRGFIVAPAGSGKTLIASSAISRVVRTGMRVLWLANTREQVEQGIAAIQRTPGPAGVDFEVCCVAAQPDASAYDVVIFDEAHHAPADSWSTLARRVRRDAILWGFSATPWADDPDRDDMLRSTFLEFHTIGRELVLASGHLAPGKVFMHDLDTLGQFDQEIDARAAVLTNQRVRQFPMVPRFEHERRARWQVTQEFLQANVARNSAAVSIINAEAAAGQSVLALVFSIEHGEELTAKIPGAAIVHSKLGAKARRGLIEAFRDGSLPVLFATSLADEGLDTPRASRLILVAGGRSAAKLEQRSGRVLRPFAGKNRGEVHDFMDRGARFAVAQARARMATYSKLGYDPEILRYNEAPARAA
jgi:superfamily II DNA or RNA helicase